MVKLSTNNYDTLLYGKDPTERIVACETVDNTLILFIQEKNGNIRKEFRDNVHWILLPEQNQGTLKKALTELDGDGYYKWIKTFDEREQFLKMRQYWKKYDPYSIYDGKEASQVINGFTYYKGINIEEVSILSFDIETTGLTINDASQTIIIANTLRKNGKVIRKMFCYNDYKNQKEMIAAWCEWVREVDPSIMCGHNIFGYDLPYLFSCSGEEMLLGRDGSSIMFDSYESKFRRDGSQFFEYHNARIFGREIIDTMFLAYKYDVGRKYENYGLKQIIKQEGLEVDGRVHYDASTIKDNYQIPEEFEKIKSYASFDGDDALNLFDLMAPSYFYLCNTVPMPFQNVVNKASGSQINLTLIRAYLQENHSIPQASEATHYEGAISLGNPGIYHNVVKVDVASLYPSIMRQYKVCDEEKDPKGYFVKIVDKLTVERLKNKELGKKSKHHKDLSESSKIFINSMYGMLGAPGLHFNSPEKAAFITQKGREFLQMAMDWAKSKQFQIVNADTDSISFCREDMKAIKKSDIKDLIADLNTLFPELIRWEDDGYYKDMLVVKAKNYVMDDGEKKKIKGSALKASMKELALKEFINKSITMLLKGRKDTIINIYNEYVKEALNVKDIQRWAFKKTITDKVMNPERTNEKKVFDAIEDEEFFAGDKAFFVFKEDNNLVLIDHFNGDYSKEKLLTKLYATIKIFSNIIDLDMIPDYTLVRNKDILERLTKP